MDNIQTYDVICVGAGLVGRLLTVGLAQQGLSVLCVDQFKFDAVQKAKQDGRTTSISWGSKLIFEQLGLWQRITEHAQPIQNIKVFELGSPHVLTYDAQDLGNHPMGYIVENEFIFRALFCEEALANIPKTACLDYIAPAQVIDILKTESSVKVHLDNGITATAPLLIAADGRHSKIRKLTRAGITSKDYKQNALVVHIAHEKPHNDTAFEIFKPEGPLAVLPLLNVISEHALFENRSGLVWCESDSFDFSALTDDEITQQFLKLFPYLGNIQIVSKRWVYPLSYMKVSSMVEGRIVLCGDAGHVMHPIAGQGVNLGWRDAAWLIEQLGQTKRLGGDIGAPHLLATYERHRKTDRLGLLYATDSINQFYKMQALPLRFARNTAFAVLNHIKPLKRFFMRRAMGLM